jgi:molybdopterin molybdotransferase
MTPPSAESTEHDAGPSVMIPLAEAQRFVLDGLSPLAPVTTPLADAQGRVGAEQVTASAAVPGFRNSSMDGYALRAVDTRPGMVQLRVVDSVLAGEIPRQRIEAGEAARIMTGAPLPQGADSICKIEEVEVLEDGALVQINRVIGEGDNVRHPGEDVSVGQILIWAGSELAAAHVGVLAGQGISSVLTYRRPRVGVLSTGDELFDQPGTLPGGSIRDSNRPMLLASVAESGFEPIDLGIVGDDYGVIFERLTAALSTCDAVITTGGVSVGDADHVKHVLTKLCDGRARSMQVAIKPGKPFAFGRAGRHGVPVFGLAGNPVSSSIGFELFVRPALRRLAGHQDLWRPTATAILDSPLPRRRDGKLHFVPVIATFHADGRLHVSGAAAQRSHLLHSTADTNAIAVLADGDGRGVDEQVEVMILDLDRRSLGGPTTVPSWW